MREHRPVHRTDLPSRSLLGLPVWEPTYTIVATAALAAYYLLTMQRGLSLYDSPELAMVAEQLGLGHPIGQPLHTMLGWLTSKIGPDPLVSLNAFSAVVGALTVIPAVSLVDVFRGDSPQTWAERVAGPASIATVGLHPLLWEPATRIEAYPLAVWLGLWGAARIHHGLAARAASWHVYAIAGFSLGLAATANAYCALGVGLALLPRVFLALRRREVSLRAISAVVPAGIVGLLPFLYVPLVAQRSGVVVWGGPDNFDALVRYFSGSDYARARALTGELFVSNVEVLGGWAYAEGIAVLLLMGALGYAAYSRRGQLGGVFFALLIVIFAGLVASNAVFAPGVLDYLGYLAVPGWVASSGVGLLIARGARNRQSIAALAGVALVLMLVYSSPQPWNRTRNVDHVTESIAENALASVPPSAIVVVQSDHWVAPLWYLHEQRGLRQDTAVLAYGLASSAWFWEHLFDRHPDLQRIPLRGGNRDERIRRFLEANDQRPVVVEHLELAASLQLEACLGDWLWGVPPHCPRVESPAIVPFIAEQTNRLGAGSPGTGALLAELAFQQGYGLQLTGRPRAAVQALAAAAPASLRPDIGDLDAIPERSDKPPVPPPARDGRLPLGDVVRNLDFAGSIASSHGAQSLAEGLSQRAAAARTQRTYPRD